MKAFLLFLSATGFALNTFGQTSLLRESDEVVDISKKVFVLEDTSGHLSIRDVSSPAFKEKFTRSNQSILHFGLTNKVYWFRVEINNLSGQEAWLQFDHAFIPEVEVFSKNTDGQWQSVRSGYKIPMMKKPVHDQSQIIPISTGSRIYYARITPYMHPVPVKVWNSKSFQFRSAIQKMVYGFYIGILVFVVIVHLFLFITLRHSYYLMYCLLILSYINASLGVLEGYFVYFLPGIDLMYTYKIIPVINIPVLLSYCVLFLETKKSNPVLFTRTKTICIVVVTYLIVLHWLPMIPVFAINYVLALLAFLWACYIGVDAGRKGNKLGYYYSFTFLIWFCLLSLEELNIQMGYPRHLFELTYVSVATLVEAFLLALLLAKRFQWDKQHNEKEKSELLDHMKQIRLRVDQEILKAQLEIKEQTFNDISQEIHDNIGQTLSVINIYLETIGSTGKETVDRRIIECINLVAGVIRDLKNIARSINADHLRNIGLTNAIRQQVNMLQKTDLYEIEFSANGEYEDKLHNRDVLIFRIIQELLNNIIKHSGATKIDIRIIYTPENVSIMIWDNGKGYVPSENPTLSNGMGIHNINKRLFLMNGEITMQGIPQKGTDVRISIPMSGIIHET